MFSWSSLANHVLTSENFDSVTFYFASTHHSADQNGMPDGKIQAIVSDKQKLLPSFHNAKA
jgi:hypothetical protein